MGLEQWWLLIGRFSLFSFPEASSGRLLFGLVLMLAAWLVIIQQIFAASGQNQRKSKTFASTSSLNYQNNDNERRRRILRGEGRRQEDQRGQGKLLKPLLFLMSAFLARLLTEYTICTCKLISLSSDRVPAEVEGLRRRGQHVGAQRKP